MTAESITIIRVRDVLLVTLPAEPDDATMSALQEKLLQAMERHGAKGLVLDISAVDTFDSFFARTLTESARMLALMGGRTIIAGMRPHVAITAAQLGLRLDRVTTALDTDRAFDMLGSPRDGRGS
jgi:rsbT antagonist protein RsbS